MKQAIRMCITKMLLCVAVVSVVVGMGMSMNHKCFQTSALRHLPFHHPSSIFHHTSSIFHHPSYLFLNLFIRFQLKFHFILTLWIITTTLIISKIILITITI